MKQATPKTEKIYVAVDQYGRAYPNLCHPRKDLCKLLSNDHVDKMYIDKKSGGSEHIGYVIGGLWLTVYEQKPFHSPNAVAPPAAPRKKRGVSI